MDAKRCYFIGNTHIDHTWLWNWTDGFDEVRASWWAALDRMQEFPEFVFTCSTTLLYRWMEEHDPELFARIRERVAEGRWQLAGGWVVQSDNNIPGGEAFVRQGLYGQLYFQSRFGKRAQVGYCVDSFGHHAQLPQILQGQGMIGWLHFRPSPHELTLPNSPYRWRGIDGTEVVGCRPPGWYCTPNEAWYEATSKGIGEYLDRYPEALFFYGVGDHGGGPTIRDLETIRRFREEHPEIEGVYGELDEFYRRAHEAELPLVEGELQHCFRGCYTSNSRLKELNRRAEGRLLAAEKMAAATAMLGLAPYPKGELDRAWDQVLTNHFHDVICGTCAPGATEEALFRYGGALETADRVRHTSLQRFTSRFDRRPPAPFSGSLPLVVTNSLSWGRCEPVWFYPHGSPGETLEAPALVDGEGRPVACQRVEPDFGAPGPPRALFFTPTVPAGGAAIYHVVNDPDRPSVESDLRATDTALENRYWRVEIDRARGTIRSLLDKRAGVQLVGSPEGAADLLVMRDLSDTWGTGFSQFRDRVGRFEPVGVRLLESGPLRARLEIQGEYGRCRARQLIGLYRDLDWIEFNLEVLWSERLKMVKIAFPLALRGARSRYEIPYGSLERPVDGTEQPMQKWLQVEGQAADGEGNLIEYRLGIAADSIGAADVLDREDSAEVRLTLLRSPFAGYLSGGEVDPTADRPVIDQGVRWVTYRLVGGVGDLGLPEHGEAISQPLQVVFEGSQPGELRGSLSLFRCDPPTVHLTALKQAEDGDGFIARLVETRGRATVARLAGPEGFPAIETCLRPFEIQSWRWHPGREPVRCNLLEEGEQQC